LGETELGTAHFGIGGDPGPAAVEDEPNMVEVQIFGSKGKFLVSVGMKEFAYMFVPLWRCCMSGASAELAAALGPCAEKGVLLFIRRLGREGVFLGRSGKGVEFDAPAAVEVLP
jgi:hypothetical protein